MAEKLCQLKKKGGGSGSNAIVPKGYYTNFKSSPNPLTALIPDTESTIQSSGMPFLIFNTAQRAAQVKCQYVSSVGGFRICTVTNGETTNLGEKVDQWVNVTSDYVIIEGNIQISLKFRWV